MGNVLLYVHEDLGDDFFCMICTSMTHTCHIVSCLALKSYFLVVLEISPFRVMVVTQIMESLICIILEAFSKAKLPVTFPEVIILFQEVSCMSHNPTQPHASPTSRSISQISFSFKYLPPQSFGLPTIWFDVWQTNSFDVYVV